MTGDCACPPDVPEGVAVIRKPFSTAELILAVHSTLKRSAELAARMRELAERNQRLRSELNEAVQKSFENLRQSSDKRR
jgi:vacuolar-type H+-ATPase subunit D/Vma8